MFLNNKKNTVFHYGANMSLTETERYIPIPVDVPINSLADSAIQMILDDIKHRNIDFVLASGIPIAMNKDVHDGLKNLNIPYFFVSPELTVLENNKTLAKKMLTHLGIPTGKGKEISGNELFKTFKQIPRPFVIKLNFIYQYGKQTMIVTDDTYEEVYYDLFSVRLNELPRPTNIRLDTSIVIEDVINIKREYSYHILANETNWEYLGSARDYKRIENGDKGFNCVSMGAYNTSDIDPIVHEYADKIYNFLKNRGTPYTGFMFLGIAVDENDVPHVLEINTRAGDPELQVILSSVTNDLGELFLTASKGHHIPKITHNDNKTVTVRLVNKVYNWTKPASFLPKLESAPLNISIGIEGTSPFFIKHSVFTSSAISHQEAAKNIYAYLDKQFVGQYMYRRDIGILK
jgi:phosphoribosylamine-glycine ligase